MMFRSMHQCSRALPWFRLNKYWIDDIMKFMLPR